jgi:DNA replication protein DnaC
VQDPEHRDLLEILEDCYGTRSTIITSLLPPAQWHDYLADATILATAICDGLLHNAHRIIQARQPTEPPAPLRSEHHAPI